MADATADAAVHEAAALPSASGAASREGDLPASMLAKLTSEPDVLLAAQQLGITTQHLMLRPLAAFQDKDDADPELVKMRYNHHLSRRQALAEELQQHCEALRAEAARKAAAAPPPATPSKDGEPAAAEPPTPVLSTKEQRQAELDAKLAREAVKMVRLAHKTTDGEVEYAKVALKAKLVAELGTNSGVAGDLAGSLSNYGRAVSLAETFARVDAVTAADIRETATKFINDEDHALAGIGQIFELPDYNWIRRRSYWLRY